MKSIHNYGVGDMVLVDRGQKTNFFEVIHMEQEEAVISDGYVQLRKPVTELTLICQAENRQDGKVPFVSYHAPSHTSRKSR